MLPRTILFCVFSFIFSMSNALAGSTSQFLEDLDAALAHYRESVSYLRTGNTDLAAIELDEMTVKWSGLTKNYAATPPDAFDADPQFAATLAQVGESATKALADIDAGRFEAAAELLKPIRADMSRFRAASHIQILPDCLFEAANAMDELMAYRGKPPADDDREARYDVVAKAAIYGHTLRRCDRMATVSVRDNPDFRRLVDGALKSNARIAEAIATNDSGLLFRLLIEMRSFDRLMFYRFG